ncbi:unnamed protein product [Rodentolepis nana]|uniref:Protein krueppel n=1 Tax=Rodentolepis nana TaxID=102285 RepID=A0A0R3T311_RODNA|nr:unnamed protein product [Rodentolepis nana]
MRLESTFRTLKESVIHIFVLLLAPLNKSNSIVGNNRLTKHGPLDEVDESNAKMSKGTTNKEKRFTCDVCNKTCSRQSKLNIHKLKHSGKKPFKCEACGNQFYTKFELNSHKLVHRDERPHKCRKCEKTFKRQKDLSEHMLSHNEERPYDCEECKKAFKRKHHLTVHLRSHKGKNPTPVGKEIKDF